MLNLKCRTEYSFRTAYGRPEEVMAQGGVGICDRSGTWGHVQFAKTAKKKGIKPVFGVELAVVRNHEEKEKQPINWMSFLAKNNEGLKEIYKLTSLATAQMYYVPRIGYSQLWDVSDNVYILSGAMPLIGDLPRVEHLFIEVSPLMEQKTFEKLASKGYKPLAVSDNFYPTNEDRETYEILASSNKDDRTTPMHLLDEWQWRECLSWAPEEALQNIQGIYDACNADLPQAEMVHYKADKSLMEMCVEGAVKRKVDLNDPVYAARLKREIDLIEEKKFEDYFYVVADMINYAKQHMLVGPARGSSCGSLACYLLGITDIDPLPHGLLFERFVDVNRTDLPDIDTDLQDDRREMAFEYLRQKYGADKVARLGTVMRYKAKSAIDDVARELSIPAWEVKDLKGAIIERSSGDSRAQFCILDTFEGLEIGKKALEKFPGLRVAAALEGHARQSGQHAAGVLVTAESIENYCSVDHKTGAVMIDKKDAEDLNLLKIDALGLRTLSVIQDVLDNVGWSREKLLAHPLDDEKAFDVLRKGSYSGIFQFEGFALQNICRQMPIRQFEDIAAITALARPGPLTSGGTAEYVKRHNGKPVKYIHPLMEEYTKDTHGIVVFQETVMQVVRNVGKLTWEDTSTLRKAMSKSYGKEYFDQFKVRFVKGAAENGLKEEEASEIWDQVNSHGCLSGDTVLQNPYPNQSTPKYFTIKELAENDGYIRKRNKGWDVVKKQNLFAMHRDNHIKPTRCLDAFFSGRKVVYEIVLECGKSIKATSNHRFFKWQDGWVELGRLKVGERVAIVGEPDLTERKKKTNTGSGAHNRDYHSGGYAPARRHLRAKYKICQNCKKAPYQETHHKNMNHKDHRLENLMPVCRKCHKKFHAEFDGYPKAHTKGRLINYSKIISIKEKGIEDVYDVSMPLGIENFLANDIIVHNSWSFNKSHAIAYGMVSYWCCVLKAHFPLEYAAACLRNSKDEEQVILLIRELVREGYKYKPFEREHSVANWSVKDGVLIGGLTNLNGIGEKMAADIIKRRAAGVPLTNRQSTLLDNPKTPFDHIFEAHELWGDLYENWEQNKISRKPTEIANINDDQDGMYVVIGKLMTKNLRDLNEVINVQKRGGIVYDKNTQELLFSLSDDTGKIRCKIGRFKFDQLGRSIVEEGRLGDWYVVLGKVRKGFLSLNVEKWRKLERKQHDSKN